jgi:ribose-phosphate pyrophosphokinase
MVILAGSSCRPLAEKVASMVGTELCSTDLFMDAGECQVQIHESVRGKDVFIIQTGSWTKSEDEEGGTKLSVNDLIMEMLITCYGCKTAAARRIIGVIPYLPYSHHCKMRKRGCITAKLIAAMMFKAGMHQLITLDLRHKETQGFFDFTVDNLRGSPFLIRHIREQISDYRNGVVVARSPAVTRRASAYAERLRLSLAVVHGESKDGEPEEEQDDDDGRNSPPPLHTQLSSSLLITGIVKEKPPMNVVGDVHAKIAIMIDDVIDEVDHLIAAARCLKERGAYRVCVVATHGIFTKEATDQLEQSPIDEILVTNTIMHDIDEKRCSKIKTIDISMLLAEAIRRIYYGESMSQLFRNELAI